MFSKLKKALTGGDKSEQTSPGVRTPARAGTDTVDTGMGGLGGDSAFSGVDLGGNVAQAFGDLGALAAWGRGQGILVQSPGPTKLLLSGQVMGKAWKLEVGRSQRDFIAGLEIRARAELDLPDDAVLVLMNRALKDFLENQAFSAYTNDLETVVNPQLGEEMRWLSLYEEVAWHGIDMKFWERYALLATHSEPAVSWLDQELVQTWMGWPSEATTPQTPMSFALMRGKAYLRMEARPVDAATLQHAVQVLEHSCVRAIRGLSTDLAL